MRREPLDKLETGSRGGEGAARFPRTPRLDGTSLLEVLARPAGQAQADTDLGAMVLEIGAAFDQIAPADKLHTSSWKAMTLAAQLLATGDDWQDQLQAIAVDGAGGKVPPELRAMTAAMIALVAGGGLEMPLVKHKSATNVAALLGLVGHPVSAGHPLASLQIPGDRLLDLREGALRIALARLLFGALAEDRAIRDLRVTTRKSGPAPTLVLDLEVDPYKSGAVKQLIDLVRDFGAAHGPRFDLRLDGEVAASLEGRPAFATLKGMEGLHLGKLLTDLEETVYHSDQAIATQQNLVVLDEAIEHVKKTYGADLFSNFVVVAIPHLLKDVEAFANAFLETGADPKHLSLLGIPYSTKFVEVPRLRRIGVSEVRTPESYDDFLAQVPKVLEAAVEKALATKKKLLIIEDGGYFTPYLHTPECAAMLAEHGIGSLDQILQGVVEQTSNGIWRDQKIEQLKTEVLSIPDLALKQQIEPPFVGTAVADNVAALIGRLGDSPKGRNVLVLSYGNIGEQVVQAFKGKQAVVTAWDPKPLNRINAHNAGITTQQDPASLFLDAWLIVGASGVNSLDHQRLDQLIADSKHQRVYLASGSSKRIEIDVKYLESKASQVEKLENDGEHLGTLYRFANGRELAVLADGYPVNFFGQDAQSVPSEHIAPVLAALYLAAVQLAAQKKPQHGIHPPAQWIEQLATDAYERFLEG